MRTAAAETAKEEPKAEVKGDVKEETNNECEPPHKKQNTRASTFLGAINDNECGQRPTSSIVPWCLHRAPPKTWTSTSAPTKLEEKTNMMIT